MKSLQMDPCMQSHSHSNHMGDFFFYVGAIPWSGYCYYIELPDKLPYGPISLPRIRTYVLKKGSHMVELFDNHMSLVWNDKAVSTILIQ